MAEWLCAVYGLSKRRVFYDRSVENKVIVAWSDRTVVVSIRGSKKRINFVEDAKACHSETSAHPSEHS